jgi:nucleotide-binding universal stress UspA family protein
VIAVVDAAGFGSPALMGGPGYDKIRTDLVSRAREHLNVVIDRLPATLRPTGRLLAGDPAERLASHSEDIDVLLRGSRRYGPLRAVLLGGVSGRVIRHAACPVIVVPRGVEHPLSALAGAPTTTSAGT